MATNNDISYIAFTFGYENQEDITPENIEVEITAIDDEEGTSSPLQPKAYYIGETSVFRIYLGETLIFSRDTSNEETPTPDPDPTPEPDPEPDFVNIFPPFTASPWGVDWDGPYTISSVSDYSIEVTTNSTGAGYGAFFDETLVAQINGKTITLGAEYLSPTTIVTLSDASWNSCAVITATDLEVTVTLPETSGFNIWINQTTVEDGAEIRGIYLYVH